MKFSRYLLIIFLILSAFITNIFYDRLKKLEFEEINYVTSLYIERLKNEVDKTVQATNMLKQVVTFYNGNIPDDEMPLFAQIVYNKDEHISVNFLPQGILAYSYPEELNEGALGFNVLEHPATQKDAIKTKLIKTPTLSGPYIQNIPIVDSPGEFISVPVIVARNPVFLKGIDNKDYFWGFISIDIMPSTGLLEQIGIKTNADFPFEYDIESIYQGKLVDLAHSENYNPELAANKTTFSLGDGEWTFSIYRKNFINELHIYTALIALTFAGVSFALFSLIRVFEIRLNKTYALSLVDSLTKINNKKSLDLYANETSKAQYSGFSLFFIDLNSFKPVNDEYGHAVGDNILRVFAARLSTNFSHDSFIARIGGDEFVVIVPGVHDMDSCESICTRIVHMAEETFYIENLEISISASVGYARLPHDAKNFNKVLELADKAMLDRKETNKKSR